ncbi:MAG: type II 3-dehydroquinate dehydratase [Rikenellaceae bacterium]|nr:type II 3-dehydroquinate dehydratase [Rikenellaceae bacterium]
MRILIINGPNLNLLGTREPSIYGDNSFENYLATTLRPHFEGRCELDYAQSNVEGEIINTLHSAIGRYDGVVINAGAYTHTSIAIADAIKAIALPVVEVHISNVCKREEFRHTSFLTPVCVGAIMGFGMDSYRLGVESLLK